MIEIKVRVNKAYRRGINYHVIDGDKCLTDYGFFGWGTIKDLFRKPETFKWVDCRQFDNLQNHHDFKVLYKFNTYEEFLNIENIYPELFI